MCWHRNPMRTCRLRRALWLVLLPLLLWPGQGWAAPPTFVTSAVVDQSSGGATITQSVTVSGSNTQLFVGVICQFGGSVSSVTFNGVSFGAAKWSQSVAGVGHINSGYLLASPTSGTHDVVVTVTGGTDPFGIIIAQFSDADVSIRTVPAPAFIADFADSTPQVTVADSQANDLVVDFVTGYQGTLTPNGSQTQPTPGEDENVDGWHMGLSYKAASGSNTVMDWTQGGPSVGVWVHGALALIPVQSTTRNLMLLGVGP